LRVGFIFRTVQRTPEAFIAKWKATQLNERAAAESQFNDLAHGSALALFHAFLDRIRAFRVMDPACGSGRFFVSRLAGAEGSGPAHQHQSRGVNFPARAPAIGPASIKGLEIDSYAAELARVSVWIVETQQMRRTGLACRRTVLKTLDVIECREPKHFVAAHKAATIT
jgi:hypothetical protein